MHSTGHTVDIGNKKFLALFLTNLDMRTDTARFSPKQKETQFEMSMLINRPMLIKVALLWFHLSRENPALVRVLL